MRKIEELMLREQKIITTGKRLSELPTEMVIVVHPEDSDPDLILLSPVLSPRQMGLVSQYIAELLRSEYSDNRKNIANATMVQEEVVKEQEEIIESKQTLIDK